MITLSAEYVLDRDLTSSSPVAEEEKIFLLRLQRRDAAAFDQLFQKYHLMIGNLAFRLIGNPEDAADVAQEVFLKVYQNIDRFHCESSLKTWLYRITVNCALNQKRWWKRRRRDCTFTLTEGPDGRATDQHEEWLFKEQQSDQEQTVYRNELMKKMQKSLSALPPDQRISLILRDMEGLAYDEIAALLSLSIGTVKSRIARGRETIRQELEIYLRRG